MVSYKNLVAVILLAASAANAQQLSGNARDPGIRNDGLAGAGGPLPNLSKPLADLFTNSQGEFTQVEGVTDGLGPTMNLNSCSGCHINPAVGGTSPPTGNPQVAFFNTLLNQATNTLPSFITPNGPVREARFPSDGGVHDLFTIAGMAGADKCRISQPNFAQAAAANNLIFRVPTPLFGAGFVEQITDATIVENLADFEDGGREGRPWNSWPSEHHLDGPRHIRATQPKRQRRHDQPLRVEGAEQVAPALRRRGLQRRDGHLQRTVQQ